MAPVQESSNNTSPHSPPGSSSDAASETSTVIYDHEPFSTYKDRARELARSTWPNAGGITVERLNGGSFNRVISLTVAPQPDQGPSDASKVLANGDDITVKQQHGGYIKVLRSLMRRLQRGFHIRAGPSNVSTARAETKEKEQYILRVPRFLGTNVSNEVAVLRFVSKNTAIPVPQVINFDPGSDNALGEAFTIQKRVPGANLHVTYNSLSHDQKIRVAKDVGRIMQAMLSVRNRSAGRIVLAQNTTDPDLGFMVALEPFLGSAGASSPIQECIDPNAPPAEASPAALLTQLFAAQKAMNLRQFPTEMYEPDLLDRMSDIASGLERKGCLVAGGDHYYTLAHLDFAPRNILVNVDQTPTEANALSIVSAVLDWDDAVLAPPFVTCSPQSWIWEDWGSNSDEDDDDDSEPSVLPVPASADAARLKEIFDESAGPTYCRFAYSPDYRLARQLFRLATNDDKSSESLRLMERLAKEWKASCPS